MYVPLIWITWPRLGPRHHRSSNRGFASIKRPPKFPSPKNQKLIIAVKKIRVKQNQKKKNNKKKRAF